MAVTLKDISEEVGVHVATVSRALHGTHAVHKDTRERIREAADRLNYRVNLVARGLVAGKSHTLGVLVPDIGSQFVTEVVRGAEDAAYAAGYRILLCNSSFDATREVQYVRSLLDSRVEGILIHSVRALRKPEIKDLTGFGVPVVLLHQQPGTSVFSGVFTDQFEGGMLAGKHLVDLGHREIAYLYGPRGHRNLSARIKGFTKAIKSVHPNATPFLMHGTPSFDGGYQMAKALLAQRSRVTAIFAANDMTAFGIARAVFEAGLRIPEDMSLIGFDNVELADVVRPPLTTIHQPKYEMGQAAVEIMLGIAKNGGRGAPEHRQFDLRLVERNSTSAPRKKVL